MRDYVPQPVPALMQPESSATVVSPAIEQTAFYGSEPAAQAGGPPAATPLAPAAPLPAAEPVPAPPPGAAEHHSEALAAPLPVSAVTLDEAIQETLQCDPQLRSAVENIRQARADFVTSSLLPNPSLAINGVFIPLRPITPAEPGGPPEADLIASFPIDWYLFGKRAAAMANARLGVDVSSADYADQVRQRVAGAVAAFYDLLEAEAMVGLAREDLDSLKRVGGITRQQVKLGGAGSIEVDRIQLSVLDAEREARSRATAVVTAKAQLQAFLGRCGAAAAFDVVGNLDVPAPADPLPAAEAMALAEEHRPDVLSLRTQVARAQSAITVEQTKARAQVTPTFGYQHQFQGSMNEDDFPSATATVNLTLPLFDRNQGNIAKAQSVLAQTCCNLQAQLVQIRAEIEQAAAEFQEARVDVVAIGPVQLEAAKSVRDRTRSAFQAGGKTLLDVIDAERAYRDTHRTVILSQSTYWHTLHRLNAAVGTQVLR